MNFIKKYLTIKDDKKESQNEESYINPITQVQQNQQSDPILQNIVKQKNDDSFSLINYLCGCLIKTQFKKKENNRKSVTQDTISQNLENKNQKKTLILDLDETLVHSSFQAIKNPDYIINIKVQNTHFTIYVKKRPGVDDFLIEMCKYYEIYVFTASLKEYANPVMDLLDPKNLVTKRLYREHCSIYKGMLVKDMRTINRNIHDIMLIDNSEISFLFQPENALHIKAFFDDESDVELFRLMPFLAFSSQLKDTRPVASNLKYFEQTEDEVIECNIHNGDTAYINRVKIINEFNQKFGQYFDFGIFIQNAEIDDSNQNQDAPLTNRERVAFQSSKDKKQQYSEEVFSDDVMIEKEEVNTQEINEEKKLKKNQLEEKNSYKKLRPKTIQIDDENTDQLDINKENNLISLQQTPLSTIDLQESKLFLKNNSIKSKEYEDYNTQIKNNCFSQQSKSEDQYDEEMKKRFADIRFSMNKNNLNSPIAESKLKFIQFLDQNKSSRRKNSH